MPFTHNNGFLDRTLKNLRLGWQSIAGTSYDAEAASMRPDLPGSDIEIVHRQMQDCLNNKGGDVSARSKAASLGRVYLALDETGKNRFLAMLADDFDIDRDRVDEKIKKLQSVKNNHARHQAENELRQSLQAPRIILLRQFNDLPEGVKFLVDMRADLLKLLKKNRDAENRAALQALDNDLKELLASWFDIGFLELKRITWQHSSAALLEKLIAYEAVHAIESWDDLKNRLDSDRRCFAFFHPRMPDEPLIFVEVALVDGMSDNIQALLDKNAPVMDPEDADTAIFYSISNAQKGLQGISFGNFLIKRVVTVLANEFKGIKTYATLSPVPGFMRWLDKNISEGKPNLLTPQERKALKQVSPQKSGGKGMFKHLLNSNNWHQNPDVERALKTPLMRLCAVYLQEKRPASKNSGQSQNKAATVLDPVAHFHLTNGARMQRLNWLGDTSEKGMQASAGMMINYYYDLNRIEGNHEAYSGSGKIAISSSIKNL